MNWYAYYNIKVSIIGVTEHTSKVISGFTTYFHRELRIFSV